MIKSTLFIQIQISHIEVNRDANIHLKCEGGLNLYFIVLNVLHYSKECIYGITIMLADRDTINIGCRHL